MKIRRSMKIYFVCAIMFMATITIISFSTLAANYFSAGLDTAGRHVMLSLGQAVDMQGKNRRTIMGFDISRGWENVPQKVKKVLDKPQHHLDFEKYIENGYWFKAPQFAAFLARYDKSPNEVLYISRTIDDMSNIPDFPHPNYYQQLIIIAISGIGMFAIMLMVLLRRIASPNERLIEWARALDEDDLKKPAPDFGYSELNKLADIIVTSLNSVQTTLQREKQFLSHASHELRTPIAVVRSSSELLLKMAALPESDNKRSKQLETTERIQRAGKTMTNLCETLLWLNRRHDEMLPSSNLELSTLVNQLTTELNYLIRDKNVSEEVTTTPGTYPLPATLCRIVLSNIIRNAYQHTFSGKVTIEQKGLQFTITNYNYDNDHEYQPLGFGLGLELVERIITQYQWQYQVEDVERGRKVRLDFSSPLPPRDDAE